MLRRILAAWMLVSVSLPVTAGIVEDIAADPDILDAEISPNGDYLAALREIEGKRTVVVFKFPSMELSTVLSFPGRNEVGNFWWINDERILASVLLKFDRLESEISRGELFAVNADGSKSEHLFGYRAAGDQRSQGHVKRKSNELAWAQLVDPLWNDDKHVLVEIGGFTLGYNTVVETAKLNVYTGRVRNRTRGPAPNAFIVADSEGNPRFSYSTDDNQNTVIHIRDLETKRWEEFASIPYGGSGIEPSHLTQDGKLIVRMEPEGKPHGLYVFDPDTKETEEVYQHDIVSVNTRTDYEGNLYGTYTADGIPEFVSLDDAHPHSKLIKAMKKAFPGRVPYVTSSTHDYQKTIVALIDDNHTPEYYIYDRGTKEVSLLFDTKPQLDDSKLGTKEPVVITARDGLELHGYLSIPPGSDGQDMPFVIVPHGGPHGPRDHWQFGWESFIPASGYAMLQINYRGSGGYGTEFENAGHGEWPGKMQDDLTDSVKWAIAEGIADPERVCIFGWSYGGYAAAMSIAREPDLYKCSAAGAGALDLEEQYNNSDFAEDTRWGHKYLDKVIGPTKEDRLAASPISHIDKIKTPVLLIHGEEDRRVTVENSRKFAEEMKKAGKPLYKYVELANEPHSPSNPENWTRVFTEVIDFLEKHIGPGSFAPEA